MHVSPVDTVSHGSAECFNEAQYPPWDWEAKSQWAAQEHNDKKKVRKLFRRQAGFVLSDSDESGGEEARSSTSSASGDRARPPPPPRLSASPDGKEAPGPYAMTSMDEIYVEWDQFSSWLRSLGA